MTFYTGSLITYALPDFLGVKNTASQDEITRAHRKRSKSLHPDKAKQSFVASRAAATPKVKLGQQKKRGVNVNRTPTDKEIRDATKHASERYARLGVVASVLKGSGRQRYDHFLSNGFPRWRGSGYYYARFRPGLGSVLIGLFVFGGGLVHYVVLYGSWRRQRDFVDRYVKHARRAAWGSASRISGVPGTDGTPAPVAAPTSNEGMPAMNRRQKRMMEKEEKKEGRKTKVPRRSGIITPTEPDDGLSPQGEKRKVQAENGKVLIVDTVGNVFLEEEDEGGIRSEYLLDPDRITRPTYRHTVLFRLPVWIYTSIKVRLAGRPSAATAGEDGKDDGLSSADENGEAIANGLTQQMANGNGRKRGKRNGKAS